MKDKRDLFDHRSIVGAKLEKLIIDRGYTKKELCEQTSVSRPTLDKLLAGTLTSKTNYDKHMDKIINFMGISADFLLGNIKNEYIRTRELKNIMRISSVEISKATNISLPRLEEIEEGGEATVAELRDIAMCLSVSVNCLLGNNFFEPQISEIDLFIKTQEAGKTGEISGFWGHIGVGLAGLQGMHWFPITDGVRKMVYGTRNNKKLVVPCMNNKLLYLNMQYVKELILLDEACDQPEFVEWDYNVDSGELPLVMYEALEDYMYDRDDAEVLSPKLQKYLEDFVEDKKLSEEDIYELVNDSKIYYADGSIQSIDIDFNENESVTEQIEMSYLYEDEEFADSILYCADFGGAEIILNMNQIAMLELPLLKVENKIIESEE